MRIRPILSDRVPAIIRVAHPAKLNPSVIDPLPVRLRRFPFRKRAHAQFPIEGTNARNQVISATIIFRSALWGMMLPFEFEMMKALFCPIRQFAAVSSFAGISAMASSSASIVSGASLPASTRIR